MVDNNRLRAIGAATPTSPDEAEAAPDGLVQEQQDGAVDQWEETEYEADVQPRSWSWLAPATALTAVAAWSAFYAWANVGQLTDGAPPLLWSRLIVDWSVPVILIVGLWLLAMRNSRRETGRFADAARALSVESSMLETRLTVVNRELSLARDFIAAQSRDLESLGRVAAERLSASADRLQGLIRDNGEQVEAIGRVSTTALANMDRLRDDLPVISNSARDVTNQIGNAGEVARHQLDEMIGGFNRLNEFGEASGRQVSVLRGKVEQAIAAFEAQAAQLETVLGERFAALTERSASFRADLDGREIEAFAAMRRRADALKHEVTQSADALAGLEREALAGLDNDIARVRDHAARVSEQLRQTETEAGGRWSAAIVALEDRLAEAMRAVAEVDEKAAAQARERIAAVRDHAAQVDEGLAARVAAFDREHQRRHADLGQQQAEALRTMDERLAAFDAQIGERQQEQLVHVAGLTERGDALAARLRELSRQMDDLVTQGRETNGGLSEAATTLAAELSASRVTLSESGAMIAVLTDDSVRLLELIRSSAQHTGENLPKAIAQAEARLAAFEERASAVGALIALATSDGAALAGHVDEAGRGGAAAREQLAALDAEMTEVARKSDALAEHARGELTAGLSALQEASGNALGDFQAHQAETIRALADRIAADSSAAIAAALREHSASVIAELEEAARQANASGRETAGMLRDQLARVNELAGNLEQRVARAREQAEEQVDTDFARRMALITEALNSSSIDISKAFANDVSDTAWASYLRGDRGIFTRRAVRLLDNQDARAVADIYQTDDQFRETVNRYIHDFEAMLRSVLSTRDGHPLAVTLLSSDMGKLYVALAQAIDRLRG